ncbi:MAG TPA: hypothetical protein VE734_12930 [Terriglobales bacterium]|jgi:hypothetical protein|nr:hypothetical protein [Terriglobales bacterium]
MKKLLTLLFAFVLTCSLSFAQATQGEQGDKKPETTKSEKKKSKKKKSAKKKKDAAGAPASGTETKGEQPK